MESNNSASVICRFGKRDLDGMTFLQPLFNHPIGDLLNIELRHEQLFFLQGDQVLDNVGFSEKGTRFNEADFGKPIHTLADLAAAGYWLVGRAYDPEVMREALQRTKDGYYYCVFSNQCQDWADRVRREARRIEKERGIIPEKADRELRGLRPQLPRGTAPSSVALGVLSLVLGIAALTAPIVTAAWTMRLFGMIFMAGAALEVVYAFHSRDWRNFLTILFFAILNFLGGAVLILNEIFAVGTSALVIGGLLAGGGVSRLLVGLQGRPRRNWLATMVAGAIMVLLALAVFTKWPYNSTRFTGLLVALALLAGGFSTLILSWQSRHDVQSPVKEDGEGSLPER